MDLLAASCVVGRGLVPRRTAPAAGDETHGSLRRSVLHPSFEIESRRPGHRRGCAGYLPGGALWSLRHLAAGEQVAQLVRIGRAGERLVQRDEVLVEERGQALVEGQHAELR